jgi:hypothetical protein
MLDYLFLLADYRLEIYGGAALLLFVYLRITYRDNAVTARYVDHVSNVVASRMEQAGETDVTPDSPVSQKKALRRKVRREMVRKARKANRGK